MAAGKCGGALLTCTVSQHGTALSKPGAAGNARPELQYSQACLHRAAHSSRNVNGIAWATTDLPLAATPQKQLPLQDSDKQQSHQQQQQQHQQQQQALLVTVGGDKRVRQWKVALHGNEPRLQEADCPAAWSKPSLEKDAAFCPFGVAVSGNGLFMAVAADNGTAAIAAVQ